MPGAQQSRLSLIDLHRLEEHRLLADWWRWKDLGQLLYSTDGVAGITDRDRLRFWRMYRRSRRNQAACAGMRGWSGSGRRVIWSTIANGVKGRADRRRKPPAQSSRGAIRRMGVGLSWCIDDRPSADTHSRTPAADNEGD